MYGLLLRYLPKWLALAVVIGAQAAAIFLVVMLADRPFAEFIYMRL